MDITVATIIGRMDKIAATHPRPDGYRSEAPASMDEMYQSKHNAAAIRASLDLSRSLADMRNPRAQ